jgi:hypothetical protein
MEELVKYSNPQLAQKRAFEYLGKSAVLYTSATKGKKYDIYDPNLEKWISFGSLGYADFTKHRDERRRQNYLNRSKGILGKWKDNPYSKNNLARNILW